ncbi:concanavalin A-like lectin/glucanase domain-containing protein [Baffinella frigidus]|nr:concanavalin A-like lectin/glucanase domain-containing protein [Cryptophyta sp. CCMP2293]
MAVRSHASVLLAAAAIFLLVACCNGDADGAAAEADPKPLPWASWKLSGEDAVNNTVPDSCGRFDGFIGDGDECVSRPCVWRSEGYGAETALAFNPGGFVVVPSVFVPMSSTFTVELLFSPACQTTNASATQGLLRFLNESSVFSPRLLLLRGRLVSLWALQDARDNTSYLSSVSELHSTAEAWEPGVWTHVAAVLNSSAIMLYINGTLDAWHTLPADSQLAGTCESRGPSCYAGRGLMIGEGFNGRLARVSLYKAALSEEEIAAHAEAFLGDSASNGSESVPDRDSSSSRNGTFHWCGRREVVGEVLDSLMMIATSAVVAVVVFGTLSTAIVLYYSGHGHSAPAAWSFHAQAFRNPAIAVYNEPLPSLRPIPEHITVQQMPLYPSLVLVAHALLLAISLSGEMGWIDKMGIIKSADGALVNLPRYILWAVSEAGGSILLLSLSEYLRPQSSATALVWSMSALLVLLGLITDITGFGFYSSRWPTTFPGDEIRLAYCAGNSCWDPERDLSGKFPLMTIAALSLVPVWVLVNVPCEKKPKTSDTPSRPTEAAMARRAVHERGTTDERESLLSEESQAGSVHGPRRRDVEAWRGLMSGFQAQEEDMMSESSWIERGHREQTLDAMRAWYFATALIRRMEWVALIAMGRHSENDSGVEMWVALIAMGRHSENDSGVEMVELVGTDALWDHAPKRRQ